MAILGRWRGTNISAVPTTTVTTPSTNLFTTQVRNDDSTYSLSNNRLTLPASGLADGYLLAASVEFEDTSNGRHMFNGQISQASGTGSWETGAGGGYNRDTSEDRAFIRCWTFVANPSASSTYDFEWWRDTDAPTGSVIQATFEVIPLYFSNHGLYRSNSGSLYGGTTPNQVTGWTVTNESDTNAIQLVSNVVTLKGDNKRYLILGSQYWAGRGGRTQRWMGLEIDGTKEDAAKAYAYYRNAANDQNSAIYTWLIETATADVTVETFCYRGDGVLAGQGGADIDGSTPSSGFHTLAVIELNDGAEVFRSENTAQSGDLNVTGPVDLNCCPTAGIAFNDSASWTRASDSAMNAEVAMDALIGANISAAQEVVSTTSRWTSRAHVTVNGSEDNDTRHGNYARNNQGGADTFGWSASLLSYVALSLNDDVGCSIQELAGGEDGGQYETQVGWNGFWGINLDTLEAASGVTINATAGSFSMTGQVPDVSSGVTITSPAKSSSFSGLVPEVAGGAGIVVSLGASTFSGLVPDVSTGVTVSSVPGNTPFSGLVPVVLTGVSVSSPAGTATFTGQVPVVGGGASVDSPASNASFSGPMPAISTGAGVQVSAGTATFTGYVPILETSVLIIVPLGSASFSGLMPVVGGGTSVVVPPGGASFSELIPGVAGGAGIVASTGTTTFNGLVPDVTTGAAVVVPLGNADFQGYPPLLGLNTVVQASAGNFSMTGQMPELSTGVAVAVPLGAATFEGKIPTISGDLPVGLYQVSAMRWLPDHWEPIYTSAMRWRRNHWGWGS